MDIPESTYLDMRALNERLAGGSLFLPGTVENNSSHPFFVNLQNAGFNPDELVVLSLTPDGDGTVIGRFLTTKHELYRFDIDLFAHDYSQIERVEPRRGRADDPHSLASLEGIEEAAGRILLEERRNAAD